MNNDILRLVLAVAIGVPCLAETGFATDWYVNDADTTLDVYCTAAGNDANDGRSKATPKLSVMAVSKSEMFQPGDTLYIDTGRYELGSRQVVFTRSGTEDARITVRGSPNGTYLSGSGTTIMRIQTGYADYFDLKIVGTGTYVGLGLDPSFCCSFTRVDVLTKAQRALTMSPGSYSNRFSHGVITGFSVEAFSHNAANVWGNAFCSMVFAGQGGGLNLSRNDTLSKFENNVVKVGGVVFPGQLPEVPFSGNVLSGGKMSSDCVTLADLATAVPDLCVGNVAGDPLFVDEAGGDYHLQSPYGYWKTETNANGYVTGGTWVTNAALAMSPGVDFGDDNEWASWTNEPVPNGRRVNAGVYGGTEQASKGHADGQKWLYAASFNDGGNLIGSGVFEWRAGGFSAGEKVRLQYTHNGTTWSNIATVVATNETYKWTVPEGANGAWTMWRVRTTNSTGWIASTNGASFSIRNRDNPAIPYYVNDASCDGDVYCSAAGSDENTGADSSNPKATLKSVLDTYQLLPGDMVYVDTGIYEDADETTTLSALDAGTAEARVRILGAGPGTVFKGKNTTRAVMLVSGDYYELRDFAVTGGRYGLQLTGNTNHVEGIQATYNKDAGVAVGGTNNVLDRIVSWKNENVGVSSLAGSSGAVLDHSVVWENGAVAVSNAAQLAVWNSVLGGNLGYAFAGNAYPAGDYNVLNAGELANGRPTLETLLAVTSNNWTHSIVRDVQFANAGEGDFHLKEGSPAIDAGNPDADFSLEPLPNGNRLNIGLYGNTTNAAKSSTNAWIQLLSFVDGGTLDTGTGATIRWNYGNIPEGATLTLWLRRSASGTWEKLATNIVVAAGEYFYKKDQQENQSALEASLCLTLDSPTETVRSETEKPMEFKDGAYSYYVNDSSPDGDGDVYCTVPGDPAADGLGPGTPVASVAQLLRKYNKFSPGDVIYVDTGTYADDLDTWLVNNKFAGSEEHPIRIVGSTNLMAGGTQIGTTRQGASLGIRVAGAEWVEISNIVFVNCSQGAVIVTNATHIVLDGLSARGGKGTGFRILGKADDITLRHVVSQGMATGLELGECTDVVVEHSVFADNGQAVKTDANSGATLQNSILYATNANQRLYSDSIQAGAFSADYNGIFAGGDARITASGIENLRAWQVASGLDAHSVSGNPLMADPAGGDFHLMTSCTRGRWLPNGQRTTDTETSPLIGAGRPPAGGGPRPNIGLYGDTPWASLPPSGKWLRVLSFNDAGGVGNESVALCWLASAAVTNNVCVEVSRDGGKTWPVTVAESVNPSEGGAVWDVVESIDDTPAALWRVRSTSPDEPSLADSNDAFFAIRRQPLKVYVATADTNDTVYVSAPARADNWEATPSAPLDSLQAALDAYDLEGGDTVYIDRGLYSLSEGVRVGCKDSGQTDNPVRFVGVTNRPFDGAMFQLQSRSYGSILLDVKRAENVHFSHLSLSNAWIGVRVDEASRVDLDQVRVMHMSSNSMQVANSSGVILAHSVFEDSLSAGLNVVTNAKVTAINNYIASSTRVPIRISGGLGSLCLTNNILEATGMGGAVFAFYYPTYNLSSDYNCIRASDNANVAVDYSGNATRFLNEWQVLSANDVHSVGYEPLMADPENGDYHLLSSAGRYDPVGDAWLTSDEQTSRLIDLGAPDMDCADEPKPNGGRVNMGVFGGTTQASKTAVTNFIVPLTMSSGGTIRGDVDLYWTYSAGYSNNTPVNVLLSTDNGNQWICLASNIYIDQECIHWASTNAPSTAQGVWKVELADDPSVFGQTDTKFSIKNDPLAYYVNDNSTDGDIYCSARGTPYLQGGNGTSPDTPIDSLASLLGRYKLEAGDIVYVDTGTYRKDGPVQFNAPFEANTNGWLVIQGSTNYAKGGTVLLNTTNSAVLELQNMHSVEFRDLRLSGGSRGVLLNQSSSNRFWRVASEDSRMNGFEINHGSTSNFFDECAAVRFSSTGLVQSARTVKDSFLGTNAWNGGIFITKGLNANGMPLATSQVVNAAAGLVRVENSVFALNGPKDVALLGASGSLDSDHNAFWLPENGALIARVNITPVPVFGIQSRAFDNLADWRAASGQDSESFVAEPLWLDAANFDYHVRSEAGHYDWQLNRFTNDVVTSALLGAGSLAGDGKRRNVGWYGMPGDSEASLMPDNASPVILDYADGGVLSGKTTLRWIARGTNLPASVKAAYVGSGGVRNDITGTVTVSNGIGYLEWDTSTVPVVADPLMRWNLWDGTDWDIVLDATPFCLHNGPISYYVNDASIEEHGYCTQSGSEENTGVSPDSPLASVSDLLRRYHLTGGDKLYWDAGGYDLGGVLSLDNRDSGSAGNPVEIIGAPHGKTVVTGLVDISNAEWISLKNLVVNSQGRSGNSMVVQYSSDIALDGIDMNWSDWSALDVLSCSNLWASHMSLAHAQTNGLVCEATYGAHFNFMTICSNGAQQIVVSQNPLKNSGSIDRSASFMTLSNSVVAGHGTRIPLYDVYGTLYADYNDLFASGGALIALTHAGALPKEHRTVNSWYNDLQQDASSLAYEPGFVDGGKATTRGGDFHLLSTGGHYDASNDAWIRDTYDSPLLDAGDPAMVPPGDEPGPELGDDPKPGNGGRVNLGRYGGTDEASRTSDAASGLTLVALNDGGRASGERFPITWLARGDTAQATLTIRYEAGSFSTNLATGVAASSGVWHWDTTSIPASVQGYLILEASDGSTARNAAPFSVRNPGDCFAFYVNDGDTEGDEYCFAIGKNGNDGLSANTPMLDLQKVLDTYKLESGDVVYIDTGVYKSNPWRITQDDSAEESGKPPVVFQGATNRLYNGTVLEGNHAPVGIQIDYAIGVSLRNITVSNTSESAISINNSHECDLRWVTVGDAKRGVTVNEANAFSMSRCVLHHLEGGIVLGGNSTTNNVREPLIEHCVVWKPEAAVLDVAKRATVRHNVFASSPGQYVYSLSEKADLDADYNAFVLEQGARVFQRRYNLSTIPSICETVGAWVNYSGLDAHSYDGDPEFANADALDFHLRSRAGRFENGTFVKDGTTSPLVDAGDPGTAVGEEPSLNGARINVGLYGGTEWASKSDSDGRFNLLTYNNGGVAAGRVSLNWNALGTAAGTTVKVDVSLDGGNTWPIVVGEGIEASAGGVLWNSTDWGSSVAAKWRIADEHNPANSATSEKAFILHNVPLVYYVNDDKFQTGDYCSAPGSDANDGCSPATPKRTLSAVLDACDLEPGDMVLIDSGSYQVNKPIVVGDLDSGDYGTDPAGLVSFIGQTNKASDATVFITANPECDILCFKDNSGFAISHLQFIGASNAVSMDNTFHVTAEWLTMKGGYRGISMMGSSNVWIRHSLMQGNEEAAVYFSGVQGCTANFDSCVMWSNRFGIHLGQGVVGLTNSVVGVCNDDAFAYYSYNNVPFHRILSDYNDIFLEKGMVAGFEQGNRTSVYSRVSTWSAAQKQDTHSLVQNPLFVDSSRGDFHLMSTKGHWDAQTKQFVTDGATSPLIDAGPESSQAFTAEPDPNGQRLNIGLYGGSDEASLSPPNGRITALSLVDGGSASGVIELRWQATGAATNDLVVIDLSYDGGQTWTNTIVDGYAAVSNHFSWDSSEWGASAQAMWRITSKSDLSVTDGSMVPFVLRNGGSIAYYVNDGSLEGDVYCNALGSDGNDGLTPETPKASLQAIVDAYDLSPEDVVYVDAGTYVIGSSGIVINGNDSGTIGVDRYVTIQGSTNPVARSVLRASSPNNPSVVSLSYAQKIKMRDLTIRGSQTGVKMDYTIDCCLENVRIENCRKSGLSLDHAEGTRATHSLFWQNDEVAAELSQSDFSALHCVLWGSPSAFRLSTGSLSVEHSVLDAYGPDGRVYPGSVSFNVTNGVKADYNAYSCRNGALIAEQTSRERVSDYYGDLVKWSAASGQDRHSQSTDPLFADVKNGDFHLLSQGGRFTLEDWDERDDHWNNDFADSPLIDAGRPFADVGDEPVPNGNTLNIGMYGGTEEASRTYSNTNWIRALSLDSPSVVSGPVLLHWSYGGFPDDSYKVSLEYYIRSGEQGAGGAGTVIATNIPIAQREYEWNITNQVQVAMNLRWRVRVEGSIIFADSLADISVKTDTYDFYVNDESTDGDVYCTAPGLPWDPSGPTNQGRTADCPFDSLKSLFAAYPVGAGDCIYIDTGRYDLGADSVVFDADKMGIEGAPVQVVGSTNGSVFTSSTNAFVFRNTRSIVVSNISVESALSGFVIQNASGIEMANVRSCDNEAHGLHIANGANINIENALFARNGGYGVYSVDNTSEGRNLCNGTVVDNFAGGLYTDRSFGVSNSIFANFTTNAAMLLTLPSMNSKVASDYNLYWSMADTNAWALNSYKKTSYANLAQWQSDEGVDEHSFWMDPLFVDVASGDYHLQSRSGVWTASGWTNSPLTSWGIDAAHPELPTGAESEPNGLRRNLGFFGGTSQASRTDGAVPELEVLTLRDGGVAPLGQLLCWAGRGLNPDAKVRLEYSKDNGNHWETITDEYTVRDGAEGYRWGDLGWTPSPLAQWRVVLATNDTVVGQTPTNFIYRPSRLVYYVNDSSREGDVYAAASGSPANNGYEAGSPLDSIDAVLARYQLTPDDMLLIDSGNYALSNSVVWTRLNAGSQEFPVIVQGSTNPAVPSILFPAEGMTEPAFAFAPTHDVILSHLTLLGFSSGITMGRDDNDITLRHLDIVGSTESGMSMNQANRIFLDHVLVRESKWSGLSFSSSKVAIDASVFWNNATNAITLGNGADLTMSNSLLHASGFGNYCYYSSTNISAIKSDYNNLFVTDNAQIASINGVQYERLPQWTLARKNVDVHSLSTDPLCHDPDNGDFHVRSIYGRFEVKNGALVKTRDTHQDGVPDVSPMVDTGAPESAWDKEPSPNGRRREIGIYGNTPEASLSSSNDVPWLLAITAMSGGLLSGTCYLSWAYGGDIEPGAEVNLLYLPRNGGDWKYIATRVKVGDETFRWSSDDRKNGVETWPTSPQAYWRIELANNTNVFSSTAIPFGLRNQPFKYYVNDLSTEGDAWCTAIGDDGDANSGFWPDVPKYSIQSILEAVDIEPTDEIYMDTGDYFMTDTNRPIRWQNSDGGLEGMPVKWIGSPEGVVIHAPNRINATYLFESEADYLTISNIEFSVGTKDRQRIAFNGTGLEIANVAFSNVNLDISSASSGYRDMSMTRGGITLSGLDNAVVGLESRYAAVSLRGTNVALQNSVVQCTNGVAVSAEADGVSSVENCTIVSSAGTAVLKNGLGTLSLRENILVAGNGRGANGSATGGPRNAAILDWQDGILVSDWNDFHALDSRTWLGVNHDRKWETLAYWQADSGLDANSVAFDPLFADANAGDYHLLSREGRCYDLPGNKWTNDVEHSPVIDMGRPGAGDEPLPNGSRRNLGAYGGTVQASKSRTNFWVQALTLNDGGVLTGDSVTLRWATDMALGAGKNVNLLYSLDGGTSWKSIVSNLPALDGNYEWDISGLSGNSFNALWRVEDAKNPEDGDSSDKPFNLRKGPADFYVSYTNGDDGNDGLAPENPMQTFQGLFDKYDLEGGDTVHAAAGIYNSESNLFLAWSRSGEATNRVRIVGELNETNGIAAVGLPVGNPSVEVRASHVDWSGLAFSGGGSSATNSGRGFFLTNTVGVVLRQIDARDIAVGVDVHNAQDTEVLNSSFNHVGCAVRLDLSTNAVVRNLTVVDIPAGGAALRFLDSGSNSLPNAGTVIENNIFVPSEGAFVYDVGVKTNQLTDGFMDYNLYDFRATGSGFHTGAPTDLRHWQLKTTNDLRSSIEDALLYNPEGTYDGYYLQPESVHGRWFKGGFVTTDSETSFAVDHGDPDSDWKLEPPENGGRINIGRFGGTPYASKGSGEEIVEIRTLNEGGRIPYLDTTWPLVWHAQNVDPEMLVYVQFLSEGVAQTISTNKVYDECFIWDINSFTTNGHWCVVNATNGAVLAMSENPFVYRDTDLGFSRAPYLNHGLMRVEWEGALAGKHYVIQYSDDFGETWERWPAAYNGPETIHRSDFVMQPGETATTYVFEDLTSFGKSQRWYRIIEQDDEGE